MAVRAAPAVTPRVVTTTTTRATAKPPQPSARPTTETPVQSALFQDGWEEAVRQKKPKLFSTKASDLDALVLRWAVHFPERNVVPTSGDRGTVGGFNDAQLKILHRVFYTAPPTAETADIIALLKKEPAFKGTDVTDDRLKLVTRYRPDSFPFGWSDRKRSLCSLVVVEALNATPKDVAAMQVLGALRQTFPNFLSEPVVGRFARGDWVDNKALYPFVDGRLEKNASGGYALQCRGEVVGLPRFGGKLALSRELADVIAKLKDDPRIRYDHDFNDVLKMVSADLGEPFGDQQWRKLREAHPDVPDWYAVQAGGRKRFAELVRTIFDERGTGLEATLDVLHAEHGFPRYESSRMANFRREFPDIIPAFRQSQNDTLLADAERFVDEAKKNPTLMFDLVGERLGFDHNRTKALLRIIRLQDPKALPLRKAPATPYTDVERKQLKTAVDSIPVGGTARDVWAALEDQHPNFLRQRPLADVQSLARVVLRELGTDLQTTQRQRLSELVVSVLKDSAPGVSVRELCDHLRDEYGCAYGYSKIKELLRDVENNPKQHPAFKSLLVDGRYPWQIGGTLTEEMAHTVAAAMHAAPQQTLKQLVARLQKDPQFSSWPTFGTGHIAKLRDEFPEIVPYIATLRDEKKVPLTAKQVESLAHNAAKVANTMSQPTIASVARALGEDPKRLRYAMERHPEEFPWRRENPAGNVDLALAYRVAEQMEKAPIGGTLQDIVDALRTDASFVERYPAFGTGSFSTLRGRYGDVVPSFIDRDMMLRAQLIADALVTAKKGTSYDDVLKGLKKKHPGVDSGVYARENYMKWFWEKHRDRFPMLTPLFDTDGTLRLQGQGERAPASTMTAGQAAMRAARLQRIPESLPLIDFLVDKCKDAPLDSGGRYEFVCVQHLLDSQVPVYDALKKMGMSPSRTTLIGVPYSASDLVVQTLDDKGWDVRVPPLDMDVWQEEVRSVLYERLDSALDTNRKIVIMDDGGICAKLVATDPLLRKHKERFTIVEQTRRGITVADEVDLATPVVNVAQSQGKFAEGPLIASDVEAKTVERLAKIGINNLKGKKIGVVGAGTIGMPIALHLKALGADVTILDPSEATQQRGKQEKLKIADVEGPGRKDFFAAQDIIIGATGNAGITADDIANTKDGCVLGSASSKLVEIDVAALAEQARDKDGVVNMRVIDGDSHPPSVEYTLADGSTRRLLARGFPVNFDGAQENIPFEHIQLTRALMVMGLMQAVGSKVAGVKRLDPKLQKEMLEHFRDLGTLQTEEQRAVLDEAIGELQGAIDKPGSHYRRTGR